MSTFLARRRDLDQQHERPSTSDDASRLEGAHRRARAAGAARSTAGSPRTSTSTTPPAHLRSGTCVDAVQRFLPYYSSVHRGAGFKSRVSTAAYDRGARDDRALRRRRADAPIRSSSGRTRPKPSTSSPSATRSAGAASCSRRDGASLERSALARARHRSCAPGSPRRTARRRRRGPAARGITAIASRC